MCLVVVWYIDVRFALQLQKFREKKFDFLSSSSRRCVELLIFPWFDVCPYVCIIYPSHTKPLPRAHFCVQKLSSKNPISPIARCFSCVVKAREHVIFAIVFHLVEYNRVYFPWCSPPHRFGWKIFSRVRRRPKKGFEHHPSFPKKALWSREIISRCNDNPRSKVSGRRANKTIFFSAIRFGR